MIKWARTDGGPVERCGVFGTHSTDLEAAGGTVAAFGRAGCAVGAGPAGPAFWCAAAAVVAEPLCAGPGSFLDAQSPGALAAKEAVHLPGYHHHDAAHSGIRPGGRCAVGADLDGCGPGAGPVPELGRHCGQRAHQPGRGGGLAGWLRGPAPRGSLQRRRAAGPAGGDLGAGH